MLKSLPTGGFKWLDFAKFDLDKYYDNSSRGFVLEVAQEYPEELHEFHNDYPLVPDKLDIKREMLSDYQLKMADDYTSIGNIKKLISSFFEKKGTCFNTKISNSI